MTTSRIDTSHIKSPHDPMTVEERAAIRQEMREEAAWADGLISKHGDPWGDHRPDWLSIEDDAA